MKGKTRTENDQFAAGSNGYSWNVVLEEIKREEI